MKNLLSTVALTFALLCCSCSHDIPGPGPAPTPFPLPTPEQQLELAKAAGTAAMLGFVAIEKPDATEMLAVKQALALVRTNVLAVQDGNFIGALPGVKLALAKIYSKPEDGDKLAIAQMCAEDLLAGVDNMYNQHPGWVAVGDQAGQLLAAFCDGADGGYATALKQCRSRPAKK